MSIFSTIVGGLLGGLGSGGSKQETSTEPWGVQQPYLQTGFQTALQNLQAPQQHYPGRTYVPFSGQTEASLGMQEGLAQNNPITGAMGGYIQNALGGMGGLPAPAYNALANTARGGYVNQNPYLDTMTQNLARKWQESTMPALHSAFSKAGRGAGDTHALAAGKAAGDFGGQLGDIYYNNYAQERQNQLAAAQQLGSLVPAAQYRAATMAPTASEMAYGDISKLRDVGKEVEGMGGRVLQDAVNRWNFAQQQPDEALARYMNALTGQHGQAVTEYNPGNPLAGVIGGGLTGLIGGQAYNSAKDKGDFWSQLLGFVPGIVG